MWRLIAAILEMEREGTLLGQREDTSGVPGLLVAGRSQASDVWRDTDRGRRIVWDGESEGRSEVWRPGTADRESVADVEGVDAVGGARGGGLVPLLDGGLDGLIETLS